MHAFVRTCISVVPNTTSYIFQAIFTFEIKRGTNSGRRALMVTVQSVMAALKCGWEIEETIARSERFLVPKKRTV